MSTLFRVPRRFLWVKFFKAHFGGRGATLEISQTRQYLVTRQKGIRPEGTMETG
jgi:hypothetical protein